MNAAVFLDRDNTLIHNHGDLGDPDQVRLIQGAASAIASLRGLGYKIIVVTNQGGVARGKYSEADVEAVHRRIDELINYNSGATVDRYYFCPFHPQATVEQYRGEHAWRKPQPGMLLQAAQDMDLDLSQSWMIGDQTRDIEAGRAAGVRTILLNEEAQELTPLHLEGILTASAGKSAPGEEKQAVRPHFEARNLIEAVRIIAQQRKPETPEEAKSRERAARKWEAASAAVGRPPRTATPVSVPGQNPRPHRPVQAWGVPTLDKAPAKAVPTSEPVPAPAPTPAPTPVPLAALTATPSQPTTPLPPQQLTASPAPAIAAPKDSPSHTETLLKQVLQEIRSQRAGSNDFSFLRVVAIVLQMLAGVGVLAALIMGRNDMQVFLVCLGLAIMFQLGVIAALLFERH